MECHKCKKVLSKRGSHFVCQGSCEGTFHRACVRGLEADLKAGRDRTHCLNCAEEYTDGEEQEDEGQSYAKILKDIQKKVSAIPGFKKQLDDIKASMSVLSEKYDILLVEHEESKQKIFNLEKTMTSVNNKCTYLEKCNIALEQKIHDYEQSTRQHNLEIVGVEQLPNENLKDIVNNIGKVIQVNTEDIEWIKRSHKRKPEDKHASITIGFKSSGTEARDAWLARKRSLKDVTSSAVTGGSLQSKMYINEDLTKATRGLLWNAKQKLNGLYKFIWVSNGKVLVKKAEGDKTVWIRAESEISGLSRVK